MKRTNTTVTREVAESKADSAYRSMSSVVVVGGAQGIGLAVARGLAREAWVSIVWVADINEAGAATVAEQLRKDGVDSRSAYVDLGDVDSIGALVDATKDASAVAIVAGVFASSPALETSQEEFDRVIKVNTIGTFLVAQAYARQMVMKGSGAICGVASIAARMPRMRQAAYCASKAGMRQALRCLALETVPQGVRVNTVSPGPTDTPMMRRLSQDHRDVDDLARGSPEAFRPRIPAGRVGQVEDIAAAVVFLLRPESQFIAFQDLVVDGGELLGM